MRWVKTMLYVNRLPEVCRCFRQTRFPLGVVRRYLGFGSNGYPFQFELWNGLAMELKDFHDVATAWIVFFRNEYQIPKNSKTILDLGANIGCFSLRAARDFPWARIIAAEPFPTTYQRLADHVRQGAFQDRILTWKLAVAGDNRRRQMPVAGPSPSRGLLGLNSAVGEGVEVDTVSLEEILRRACAEFRAESIDFLKMDIEGAEHEAVVAAPLSALKVIRHLGMEYHPNQPKEKLFRHLIAAGLSLQHDRILGPDVGVAHFCRLDSGEHRWRQTPS
jgi:FkbM family methyltransferase